MKNKLLILLMLFELVLPAAAQSNVVQCYIANMGLQPQANVPVTILCVDPQPRTYGPAQIPNYPMTQRTDTNGLVQFQNLLYGKYQETVSGNQGSVFYFWVGLQTTGTVNAVTLTNPAIVPPGGYYTIAQLNQLLATNYYNVSTNINGSFTGNGQGLTNLASSNFIGVLPNGMLIGTYTNLISLTNFSNTLSGIFFGNGAGLSNVVSATATNVATFGGTNIFTGTNTFTNLTIAPYLSLSNAYFTNIWSVFNAAGERFIYAGQTIFGLAYPTPANQLGIELLPSGVQLNDTNGTAWLNVLTNGVNATGIFQGAFYNTTLGGNVIDTNANANFNAVKVNGKSIVDSSGNVSAPAGAVLSGNGIGITNLSSSNVVSAITFDSSQFSTTGGTNIHAVSGILLTNAVLTNPVAKGLLIASNVTVATLTNTGQSTLAIVTVTSLTNTGTFTGNGAGLTNLPLASVNGLATNVFANTNESRAVVISNLLNAIGGVFTGNGAALSNLTIANIPGLATNLFALTSDTRPLNLTNAANVFNGTVSGSGSGLTNIPTAGIFDLNTNKFALTSDTRPLNLTNIANLFAGAFTGNGNGVTNILTASVVDLNTNKFALTSEPRAVVISNYANILNGIFSGNGAGLTNLTATNIGTVANATNAVNATFAGLATNYASSNNYTLRTNGITTNLSNLGLLASDNIEVNSNLYAAGNVILTTTTNVLSVAGAGTATMNGTYVWSTSNYTNAQNTSIVTNSGGTWYLANSTGGTLNYSSASLSNATWTIVSGSSPSPSSYIGSYLSLNGVVIRGSLNTTNLVQSSFTATNETRPVVITNFGNTINGTFAGDGAGLTNLGISGTNIGYLNGTNVFTGTNTFSLVIVTNLTVISNLYSDGVISAYIVGCSNLVVTNSLIVAGPSSFVGNVTVNPAGANFGIDNGGNFAIGGLSALSITNAGQTNSLNLGVAGTSFLKGAVTATNTGSRYAGDGSLLTAITASQVAAIASSGGSGTNTTLTNATMLGTLTATNISTTNLASGSTLNIGAQTSINLQDANGYNRWHQDGTTLVIRDANGVPVITNNAGTGYLNLTNGNGAITFSGSQISLYDSSKNLEEWISTSGVGGNGALWTNIPYSAITGINTNTYATTNDNRAIVHTNIANSFGGTFTGNGGGLTNVSGYPFLPTNGAIAATPFVITNGSGNTATLLIGGASSGGVVYTINSSPGGLQLAPEGGSGGIFIPDSGGLNIAGGAAINGNGIGISNIAIANINNLNTNTFTKRTNDYMADANGNAEVSFAGTAPTLQLGVANTNSGPWSTINNNFSWNSGSVGFYGLGQNLSNQVVLINSSGITASKFFGDGSGLVNINAGITNSAPYTLTFNNSLAQLIQATWTNTVTQSYAGISTNGTFHNYRAAVGTNITSGLFLTNITAAATNAPQNSPAIVQYANVWEGAAGSLPVAFASQVAGIQNSGSGAVPAGFWNLYSTTNGFASSNLVLEVDSSGNSTALGTMTGNGSGVTNLLSGLIPTFKTQLISWTIAGAYSFSSTSASTNSDGVITNCAITWPNGVSGVYQATTYNPAFTVVDAYTLTYPALSETVTQPAVTRRASDGYVLVYPQPTVSP